ncbi:MAG: 3-ketoacyl-CoA thiolase @ Acetyl-CoA acetyltransferase [uncultured Chloroflexia bacterium]|uniref:acetyl-CoA C-acyltransferase n=1 Tax=uncultured Chloroflexia bacterium TaxID=1672391 RepID=A0A6J4I084_9CHLR|nr:MAG: 3-ketoacyl-CoA thiolase @ Acetyl-CoA acetyltransferase [uncultured Chloroflexia bacterium]
MATAVITHALRTPFGRYGGALAQVRPDDLAAIAVRALLERSRIDPGTIEDLILGCANQAGEDNRNVARMVCLLAGLPVDIPGQTVNRLCGSGLQAVTSAAHAIIAGEGDVFIAGGVESMTRAPLVMAKPGVAWQRGDAALHDTTLGWRFTNPALSALHHPHTMGETAENVAERYGISRADQDAFALESQRRYAAAAEAGHYRDELVPVTLPPARRGEAPRVVDVDEHPRPDTTLEKLAKLPPAFGGRERVRPSDCVTSEGSVTAGNTSGINDGAGALLVMSEARARDLGMPPLARIVSTAVAGVDPAFMGLGPVPATRKALARAGLAIGDLDLIELNEAFAAQSLACIRALELDPARVNVNGGAIALGHPLGASGARILTTLAHELQRRGGRYGLATMCIGVGQGIATVVEAL